MFSVARELKRIGVFKCMFVCFLQGVLIQTIVVRSTSNKNLRIKMWKRRKIWGTQINMRRYVQRKQTKRITGHLLEYFKLLQI